MATKESMLKKLISLRRPKKNRAKMAKAETMPERDVYPYGTRLDFGTPEVKKLNLQDVDVGKKCVIYAIGEVTSVSRREGDRGNSHDVCIQLKKIKVEPYDNPGKKKGY